ncbi:MAG: hypothetical protein ACKN82_06230, partial [Pirellula sp.]
MNPIRFAAGIAVLMGTLCHWGHPNLGHCHAGIALSTVQQDGLKIDYNGGLTSADQIPSASYPGSASRIATFDFNINDLDSIIFIQARIKFWVQLPPEAIGDLAPQLVFSKVIENNPPDFPHLDAALIAGDAVKTDIRISFDLFPTGLGIVEKQIDFKDLTEEQSLGLSKILSQDPQQRVDVWLASDTLKAITVPSSASYLDFSNGFPILVATDFNSTLELKFVPEPSSMAIFGIGFSLILHRSWRRFSTPKNSDKPKGIGNG